MARRTVGRLGTSSPRDGSDPRRLQHIDAFAVRAARQRRLDERHRLTSEACAKAHASKPMSVVSMAIQALASRSKGHDHAQQAGRHMTHLALRPRVCCSNLARINEGSRRPQTSRAPGSVEVPTEDTRQTLVGDDALNPLRRDLKDSVSAGSRALPDGAFSTRVGEAG